MAGIRGYYNEPSIFSPTGSSRLRSYVILSFLSPAVPWLLSWLIPVESLVAIAAFFDDLIWSHVKTTQLGTCTNTCRQVAYGMIVVPLSFVASLAFALFCVRPTIDLYRARVIQAQSSRSAVRPATEPSQWKLFRRLQRYGLHWATLSFGWAIPKPDRRVERVLERHYNPFKSSSLCLFVAILLFAILAGAATLLIVHAGMAGIPRRGSSNFAASLSLTFLMGVAQLLAAATSVYFCAAMLGLRRHLHL
jgi:hypothetical protein